MLESEESWRAGNPGEAGTQQKKKPGRERKQGEEKKRKKLSPVPPPAGQTDEKRADFSGTGKNRPP